MIKFDYFEPETLEEAIVLLEKHGDEARLLAGGTALIIWMRQRLLNPRVIVSLAKLQDFNLIHFDKEKGLRIGAGARHRDIELHPTIREIYPLLYETFRKVAQPRIRNMGTIGGNLCQGDPLTDPGSSLIALDASVTMTSTNGTRTMALEDFFIDYYETAIEPREILTEIHIPPPPPSLSWAHIKFTPRTEEDFATVGVALALQRQNSVCRDVRLALNSVATKIFRARDAETKIRGQQLTEGRIREMAETAAAESDPIEDNRGSAEYKKEMVKVMVRRAAQQALQR